MIVDQSARFRRTAAWRSFDYVAFGSALPSLSAAFFLAYLSSIR
jgi:hypothetical protein